MSFAFFFDATDPSIEDIGSFSPIPEGHYTAVIESAQIKEGLSNPNQKALEILWRITGVLQQGSEKGVNRKFYSNYWFNHESAKTQEIAQKFIKNICQAVNVMKVESTQQFVGKSCGLVVGIQKSKDPKYNDKNRVIRAFPLDGTEGSISSTDIWD